MSAVMTQKDGNWKITDGISTGHGNTPDAAKAAFDEDKAFNHSKYADHTQMAEAILKEILGMTWRSENDFTGVSDRQRREIVGLCRQALKGFKKARGES